METKFVYIGKKHIAIKDIYFWRVVKADPETTLYKYDADYPFIFLVDLKDGSKFRQFCKTDPTEEILKSLPSLILNEIKNS